MLKAVRALHAALAFSLLLATAAAQTGLAPAIWGFPSTVRPDRSMPSPT